MHGDARRPSHHFFVSTPMLSIVIPTLNEAGSLPATVEHTRTAAKGADVEIIVSDCRSSDGTAEVAQALGLRIVGGGGSRAEAMNAGASAADGETLLFLHADCRLPAGFPHRIWRALENPGIVGGAFDFEFADDPQAGWVALECLRWVVFGNRIRYRWTGAFYGDQCIFVRREVFSKLRGFPRVRLMEDVRFSRRLNGAGRTAILRPPVLASPRRFLSRGVVRQVLRDLALLGSESIGVSPGTWWAQYNGWNRSNGASAPPAEAHSDPRRLRCVRE